MATTFFNGNSKVAEKLFQNAIEERSDWADLADYFSSFGGKHFKASDLVNYFSTRDRERLEEAAFDTSFPTFDGKLQKSNLPVVSSFPTFGGKFPEKFDSAAMGSLPTFNDKFPEKSNLADMCSLPTIGGRFPEKSNLAAMGSFPTFDGKFSEKSNLAAMRIPVGGKRAEMLKLEEHLKRDVKHLTSEMCQASLKEVQSSIIALEQAKIAYKLSETVLFRVDTHIFLHRDISVKIVDNFVLIHGKHSEKMDDHGLVSREFTRKYKLPENIDAGSVKATFDRRGILAIHADKIGDLSKEAKDVPVTIADFSSLSSNI